MKAIDKLTYKQCVEVARVLWDDLPHEPFIENFGRTIYYGGGEFFDSLELTEEELFRVECMLSNFELINHD